MDESGGGQGASQVGNSAQGDQDDVSKGEAQVAANVADAAEVGGNACNKGNEGLG